MSGNRPAWTLTEAVERTGASRSTIRRYREAGRFPNAYKDTTGVWRFPLEDLLAVGLKPSAPAREHASEYTTMPNDHVDPAHAEQVSKLEQALREERARADNAERLAASYLANVEDLRRAMLMLEAGSRKTEQATEQGLNLLKEQPSTRSTDPSVDLREQAFSSPVPSPLRTWRRLLGR